MLSVMSARLPDLLPTLSLRLAKARAKLLARGDRQLKADLISLRQRAGLSQADVADLLGISQQAVYKLERYDSDPKLSTLRRYANAVGAIVEHTVTQDLGQSEQLAADARWRSVAALPTALVSTSGTSATATGWTGSSHVAMRVGVPA